MRSLFGPQDKLKRPPSLEGDKKYNWTTNSPSLFHLVIYLEMVLPMLVEDLCVG